MASRDNIIGLAIGLDTSSLKAGLQDAGRRIKEAGAEFQAVTSDMDDWRKSSEGLQAKLNQLNKVLSVQDAALKLMEKEYEETYKGQDENSAAATKLRTEILKQQATIGRTVKDINKFEKSLDDLKKEESQTEQEIGDTNKSLKEQNDAAKEAGEGFTVLKGTMANLIATGISKFIGGITNGFKELLNLSSATREYREDLGKLETAFEAAGKSTDVAKDTYEKFYGVLGEEDRSVEAVNHLAEFVETEEDMVKWSNIAAGVVGKFGDSLPIEGLTEASNETAKVGKVTGVLADALNWAGISEDEFNEKLATLNSEEERAKLITDTLNGAYAESAEHYRENNAEVIKAREEQSAYNDVMAKLGEKMEPVNSAITGFKTELAQLLLEEVDFEAVSQTVNDVLTVFKDDILPFILDGLKWFKDNLPTIIPIVTALGAAFLTFKVAGIIDTLVKSFKALNLVIAANPIGLIVTAVVGLITWLVTLYQTNEEFRDKVNAIWTQIKDFFIGAWNAIKNVWNGAKNFFSGIWTSIKSTFSNVSSWFSTKFTEAWSAVKKAFSNVGSFFSGIWDTIKSKFTDIGTKVGEAISSTFKKAVNAVLSTAENVLNKPIKAINTLRNVINKVPGINISKLSEFKLPRMAKGGIIDKATLGLVGEDGAEAVIPLERNLGWIRKLSANIVKDMNSLESGLTGAVSNVNNTKNFTQIINAPKTLPVDEMYRKAGSLLKMDRVVI